MAHNERLEHDELTPELRARLEADASSIMRYFLDLACTVQDVADALQTESHGGLSCHHPALQADRLTIVARHLRTFAVHPDCIALDAMAGPASRSRSSVKNESDKGQTPHFRRRP